MREIFREHQAFSQNQNKAFSRSLYVGDQNQKSYGFFKFVGDVFMTALTSGFWLIWVFVREMRKR